MRTKSKTGVRVIGGCWRGRRIPVSNIPGLRPTSDRTRETLFNWLQYKIDGACCLDLFAGSGVLSFEALSRGAAEVVAVDRHSQSVRALCETGRLLDSGGLTVVHDKAERLLAEPAHRQFDIVFVDPPFELALHETACILLDEHGWLGDTALVYLEAPKGYELKHPHSWSLKKSGQAGNVDFRLYQVGD